MKKYISGSALLFSALFILGACHEKQNDQEKNDGKTVELGNKTENIGNQIEKIENPEKAQKFQEHFEKKVFSADDPQEAFQFRIGDPNKAKLIFIYYSALNCPDCIDFHINIYPKLAKMKEFQEGGSCALVVRDYPYSPISLKITAIAYAVPKLTAKLRERFFVKLKELEANKDNEQLIIPEMIKIALQETENDEEKNAINNAIHNQELNQRIYDYRVSDKSALGIDEVPTAYAMIRNGDKTSIEKLQIPSSERLIMQIIEKNK